MKSYSSSNKFILSRQLIPCTLQMSELHDSSYINVLVYANKYSAILTYGLADAIMPSFQLYYKPYKSRGRFSISLCPHLYIHCSYIDIEEIFNSYLLRRNAGK